MRRGVAVLVVGSKRFVKYGLSGLLYLPFLAKGASQAFTYQPSKCVVLEHGGN
jgi:hypothetical protein